MTSRLFLGPGGPAKPINLHEEFGLVSRHSSPEELLCVSTPGLSVAAIEPTCSGVSSRHSSSITLFAARINTCSDHVSHHTLQSVVRLVIDQTLRYLRLVLFEKFAHHLTTQAMVSFYGCTFLEILANPGPQSCDPVKFITQAL